jgi:peptide/nickel transport system substrate-binding protein
MNRKTRPLFLFALLLMFAVLPLATSSTSAQDSQPIVVTWWSEPSNFDLHSFGTDGDGDARFMLNVNLIRRKQVDGPYPGTTIAKSGEYVGALAESWEENKDEKSLTFHLRTDAKFASGNPVTAEDVRYTIERGMKSPTSYMGGLLSLGGVDDPSQAVVIDDHTIKLITTNGVTPLLYELLAMVNMGILDKTALLEHATADDPYATKWLPLNAAGGGPYTLAKADPGVEFDFAPNPNYYDAANGFPKNSGINFKIIPTAADRLLLLRTGALDVYRGVPYSEIDSLKSEDGIKVLVYPSTDMRAIALNNNIKPFDNVKVRQAVAYAVPYDDILQAVWAGYATQLKGIVPDGMPTADPSVFPYKLDLDKAKSLLTEAGYPDGFETTLFTRADNQDDQQIALLLQDALSKINVKVNIESLTSGAYAARSFNDRDMPMFFFDWISYVNDPYYHYFWLMECKQGTNYANYCDPEADKLIKEGIATTDVAKREEISKQLQKMHADASPWIYLSQPNSVTAMRSNIQGWAESPDKIASDWTLYRSDQ